METLIEVVLPYRQDGPSRGLESFVSSSVTKDLSLGEVMTAVVLNGDPPGTVSEIGRRRQRVAASQCELELGFRESGVHYRQTKH